MTEPRPFKLGDSFLFLVVLLAAAGARGGYLWEFAEHADANEAAVLRVQQERIPTEPDDLQQLVANVKASGPLLGFRSVAPLTDKEETTAHVAPGYPVVRAYFEQAAESFAKDQLSPTAAMRWLQALLGTLTAGLYFLMARRAFDSSFVGFLSGVLCALNPFAVINTVELQDGTLASFVVALALYLGVRAGQQGGALTSFLFGLALAATALVRAAFLPFALVGLLGFLWQSRKLRGSWLYAAVGFLGFLGGLAPWCVRNHREFDAPIPIASTTWYHLWLGNNPQATGGDVAATAAANMSPDRRGALSLEPQPARYDNLAWDVKDEVTGAPRATIERRLFAVLYYFLGGGVVHRADICAGGQSDGADPEFRDTVTVALYGTLLGMLFLGVLGWRWSFAWRQSSLPLQLAAIWLPLPYILSHAEGLHGPRLPLDGVLLTLAAYAFAVMLPGSGAGRGPEPAPPEPSAPARM